MHRRVEMYVCMSGLCMVEGLCLCMVEGLCLCMVEGLCLCYIISS